MADARHAADFVQHRDARAQRSRREIDQAFAQLVLTRRYDQIRVQDILQRAEVCRATFYGHFADKQALLVAQLRHRVASLLAFDARRPGWPDATALFKHLQDVPQILPNLAAGPDGAMVMALVESLVADRVQQALDDAAQPPLPGSTALPAPHRSAGLPARAAAALLFMLLRWWQEQHLAQSPAALQHQYQRLLAGVLPPPLDADTTPPV